MIYMETDTEATTSTNPARLAALAEYHRAMGDYVTKRDARRNGFAVSAVEVNDARTIALYAEDELRGIPA